MLRQELDRYETELRDAGLKRNTVMTYVQPVERFFNWVSGKYRPTKGVVGPLPTEPTGSPVSGTQGRRGSRYDGLREYLERQTEAVVSLTFPEIERIIGGPLPESAKKYRPWWANEEAGTHVHARAWLDAGRRTVNVDMNGCTVDFVR